MKTLISLALVFYLLKYHTDKVVVVVFAVGCLLVPFAAYLILALASVLAFLLLGLISGSL